MKTAGQQLVEAKWKITYYQLEYEYFVRELKGVLTLRTDVTFAHRGSEWTYTIRSNKDQFSRKEAHKALLSNIQKGKVFQFENSESQLSAEDLASRYGVEIEDVLLYPERFETYPSPLSFLSSLRLDPEQYGVPKKYRRFFSF